MDQASYKPLHSDIWRIIFQELTKQDVKSFARSARVHYNVAIPFLYQCITLGIPYTIQAPHSKDRSRRLEKLSNKNRLVCPKHIVGDSRLSDAKCDPLVKLLRRSTLDLASVKEYTRHITIRGEVQAWAMLRLLYMMENLMSITFSYSTCPMLEYEPRADAIDPSILTYIQVRYPAARLHIGNFRELALPKTGSPLDMRTLMSNQNLYSLKMGEADLCLIGGAELQKVVASCRNLRVLQFVPLFLGVWSFEDTGADSLQLDCFPPIERLEIKNFHYRHQSRYIFWNWATLRHLRLGSACLHAFVDFVGDHQLVNLRTFETDETACPLPLWQDALTRCFACMPRLKCLNLTNLFGRLWYIDMLEILDAAEDEDVDKTISISYDTGKATYEKRFNPKTGAGRSEFERFLRDPKSRVETWSGLCMTLPRHIEDETTLLDAKEILMSIHGSSTQHDCQDEDATGWDVPAQIFSSGPCQSVF